MREDGQKGLRAVLDTNVWLDWVVFDDPDVRPLKAAQRASRVELVTNAACLDELARILAYEHFALDHSAQAHCLAEVQNCAVMDDRSRMRSALALPRCSDPDDQKFLELARDARADWLVTKDRALLALARRKFRLTLFRIGTPAQFAAALASPK